MRGRMALMLLAALSATSEVWAQCVAPAADRATMTVKGTASVGRRPDVADLAVTVRTRGPALDGTARDHEARVAQAVRVFDGLTGSGVAVDAGSFSLSEERAPVPPGGRPSDVRPTFRAETRYDLAMPVGAKLDAVVAEIASAGLFELGSVRFSVSNEGGAIDEVRRAAMADAKRQAEIYADGAGVRLEAVDRITDGAVDSLGVEAADLPMRVAGLPPSVGIKAPASQSFSGSVTVVWHIVPR